MRYLRTEQWNDHFKVVMEDEVPQDGYRVTVERHLHLTPEDIVDFLRTIGTDPCQDMYAKDVIR